MDKQKPVFSIVIPHKNNVEGLERLFLSIPETRSYQIIVVDDGSNEENMERLKKLISSVSPTRTIELYENLGSAKGAGAARNTGLKHVRGEWLLFADSDDYFTKEFEEHILSYIDTDADQIMFTPTSLDVATGELSDRHVFFQELIQQYLDNPSQEALDQLIVHNVTVWSKLYRVSMIIENQITFDEVFVSNDVMFSVKASVASSKILVTDKVIYTVTRNSNSLTTNTSVTTFWTRYTVFKERYKFLQKAYGQEFNRLNLDFFVLIRVILSNKYGVKVLLQFLFDVKKEGMKWGLKKIVRLSNFKKLNFKTKYKF
ncbi:MAG: glycosyltransferase [Streptococcaceae bacterium]|nr:glycosyltransferase [Streptococcaceae bacterium]